MRSLLAVLVAVTAAASPRARPASRSLRGVEVGRRVPLRHPRTGRVDRAARIVDSFVDRSSGLPVAVVRWRGGAERPVAAARVRLLGRPLSEQRAHLRALDARARRAVERTFQAVVRARAVTQPEHRFVRGLRERGVPVRGIAAYRDGSRVVLERDFAAFVPANRVHEYLHAAAAPAWTREVFARDIQRLDEGVTEWLSDRACRRERIPFEVVPGYDVPHAVGRAIEERVGRRTLEDAYFRQGLGALESALDARLGTGALRDVARALERGREGEAMRRLRTPAVAQDLPGGRP